MKSIKLIDEVSVKYQYYLLGLMFLIMLVLMIAQVIWRYLLEMPLTWSEEITRYLFIITTYLGASIATSENKHIEINVMDLMIEKIAKNQKTKPYWNLFVYSITALITFFISCLISYEYIFMVMDDYRFDQVSTALGFPMFYVSGAVFLCLMMMTIHSFIRIALSIGQIMDFKKTGITTMTDPNSCR